MNELNARVLDITDIYLYYVFAILSQAKLLPLPILALSKRVGRINYLVDKI